MAKKQNSAVQEEVFNGETAAGVATTASFFYLPCPPTSVFIFFLVMMMMISHLLSAYHVAGTLSTLARPQTPGEVGIICHFTVEDTMDYLAQGCRQNKVSNSSLPDSKVQDNQNASG